MESINVNEWIAEAKRNFNAKDFDAKKDLYNALASKLYMDRTCKQIAWLQDFDYHAWSDGIMPEDAESWETIQDVEISAGEAAGSVLERDKQGLYAIARDVYAARLDAATPAKRKEIENGLARWAAESADEPDAYASEDAVRGELQELLAQDGAND